MASTNGRSLHLFFTDGNPEGMVTAEVPNWTGHVLVLPTLDQISKGLRRDEAKRTGVYLLFDDARSRIYIGQAYDVGHRINQHVREKDWLESAALITAQGDFLNKAHVEYLEARLIERVKEAGKIKHENKQGGNRPSLSEAAKNDMEIFLEHVLMVLPALRIDCFVIDKGSLDERSERDPSSAQIFELRVPKNNVEAKAKLGENGKFVVLRESKARRKWEGGDHSYRKEFERLATNGTLVDRGEYLEFSIDYAFRSTSAAAAVVNGRPSNGQVEWKVKGSDKTYRDWVQEKLPNDD